jgi:hypothetical protein
MRANDAITGNISLAWTFLAPLFAANILKKDF